MIEYDLRKRPWIPVTDLDGIRSERGLQEVLLKAHELRSVDDAIPTVEFGLYRLLIALVGDIFKVRGLSKLSLLLKEKRFNAQTVDRYFEDNKGCFDLFHKEHPFLQSGGMEKETAKSLAGMLPPIPSGTNSGHFHHYGEEEFGVAPAVAARLLTLISPFMTAGGAGLSPSINGAPPWYILLFKRGGTLFETLCLNLYAYPLSQAEGEEVPAWRDTNPVTSERRTSTSYLESLTWRPRRIQLISGAGGVCSLTCKPSDLLIREMKFAPGFGSGFEPTWRDPAVPYRPSKEGVLPLRPQEGREVWRDTGAIAFLKEGTETHLRPLIIGQFAQLVLDSMEGQQDISLLLYGMRTDMKMKVFEWQRERLNLPVQAFWKERIFELAQTAMEKAEQVAYSLKLAIKQTYPREGKGNSKAFDTRIASAGQHYWSLLKTPYETLIRDVALLSQQDEKEAIALQRKIWETAVRHAGWDALNRAIDDLDTDADALKRVVEARSRFYGGLAKAFATEEQKQKANAKVKTKKGETQP